MTSLLSGAMAAIILGGAGLAFLAIIVCAYLVPVNILRIAQHLRGIREQLERIAAATERSGSSSVDEFRELELARRRRASADAGR